MGVPKFFRWLSERYPLINQRITCESLRRPPTKQEENVAATAPKSGKKKKKLRDRNNNEKKSSDPNDHDIMGTATLVPEIDRLYIDMNGLLHGCSHNNSDEEEAAAVAITHEQILDNLKTLLERLVEDILKPKSVIYMAIDGVAPRAKLNQQRSRRYRSSTGHEIEQTVYEAQLEAQRRLHRAAEATEKGGTIGDNTANQQSNSGRKGQLLTEVEPGRFAGKFETHVGGILPDWGEDKDGSTKTPLTSTNDEKKNDVPLFHSNQITPGTPFFQHVTDGLIEFLNEKMAHDDRWKHLDIIFSGSDVPGEGEHKILQFMREQQSRSDYNPNLRHCIMSQDGDLIMLGLATHEPNLVLFREQVVFDIRRRLQKEEIQKNESNGVAMASYVHNENFEFLHMNVLRDYLAFDLETSNVVPDSPFDLERTLDDFVFLTFFVGNDFLPHIPALDIADEAFDLLFYTYREQRQEWYNDWKTQQFLPGNGSNGEQSQSTASRTAEPDYYLTNAGEIVSGARLEAFLRQVGSHEMPYMNFKRRNEEEEKKLIRRSDQRYGTTTLPDDEILRAKEEADRAKFREMLERQATAALAEAESSSGSESESGDDNDDSEDSEEDSDEYDQFTPVLAETVTFQTGKHQIEEEKLQKLLSTRLGNLLQYSFTPQLGEGDDENDGQPKFHINDQDFKGRFYYDKFEMTPFDAEKHRALRRAYIEGLVWTLKYYYQGCASWDWYYPYHYGPMLSDLLGIDDMLEEISFEGKMGEPLNPFEQLMACMPPSQADTLPEPYRWLMTSPKSPIIDYYPSAFTVDMNGKRWPWEAVVLLPFIDTKRLLTYSRKITDEMLSAEEKARNSLGHPFVLSNNLNADGIDSTVNGAVKRLSVESSSWQTKTSDNLPVVFEPKLKPGVTIPLPGLPSLQAAPIRSLWRRRVKIDIFGLKSRYKTACLEHSDAIPSLPPLGVLGRCLIGTTIWINFPFFTEGFVTALSDVNHMIRGKDSEPTRWNAQETIAWMVRRDKIVENFQLGQGLVGTGGVIISPDQKVILSVRPFQGLRTMDDGTIVKTFAKKEIEIPIVATLWEPPAMDSRLRDLPALLEKDPFKVANAGFGKKSKDDATAPPLAKKGPKPTEEFGDALPQTTAFPTRSCAPDEVKSTALSANNAMFPQNPDTGSRKMRAGRKSILPDKGGSHDPDHSQKTAFADARPDDGPRVNADVEGESARQRRKRGKATILSDIDIIPNFTQVPGRMSCSPALVLSASGERLDVDNNADFQRLPPSGHVDAVASDAGALVDECQAARIKASNAKWWEALPKHRNKDSGTGSPSGLGASATHAAASSRGFSTLRRLETNLPQKRGTCTRKTRSFDITLAQHSPAAKIRMGSARGRIIALGAATAATLFFGSGGANADTCFGMGGGFYCHDRSSFHPARWEDVRGGGFDTAANSWVQDSYHAPPDECGIDSSRTVPPLEFAHGTTTLSFVFQGGVICAVDSRASLGNFVGSKTVQKVLPINSHILGTMAGGAADCSFWIRKIKLEAQLHELNEGTRMSTSRASRLLSNALNNYRGYGLSVGTMIMGYDDDIVCDDGNYTAARPRIFYVDDEGARIEGDMFAVGSGSTFAHGILDTERRYNMTVGEAVALGIKAIRHATFRDAFSGGFINVYLITPQEGWKKVFAEDVAISVERARQEFEAGFGASMDQK